MNETDDLSNNSEHFKSVHKRWMARRNRRQESPDYKDDWYAEQCGRCRFWLPLAGEIGSDYGVCSNPKSPFDGLARFEHDGCDVFEDAETWRGR
jgi:DUF3027 family protein